MRRHLIRRPEITIPAAVVAVWVATAAVYAMVFRY
jgi:hypothetical protein